MPNKGDTDYRILISYNEYESLLKQSDELKKYQAKLAVQLESDAKVLPKETKSDDILQTSAFEETEKAKDDQQSGNGLHHLSQEELIKEITSKVTAEVNKVYQKRATPNNQNNYQIGQGANDLIQGFPVSDLDDQNLLVKYNVSTEPIKSDFGVEKSKLNNVFQNQELIDLVPAKAKERAKKLLDSLIPFSSTITWSPNGTIYVNQTSLPDSNIFELFPKLYKQTHNPKAILNLEEVVNAIANLGFGHLISRQLTSGLNRRRNILNQEKIFSELKTIKNWYFIGSS